MPPTSQQQRLPVQPPGKEDLYSDDNPPPPRIKFSSGTSSGTADDHDPSSPDKYHPSQIQPRISLAEAIGPQRSISSFGSVARLRSPTSDLLSDPAAKATVLAPLNSAIDALPRKPWESPSDYSALGDRAYQGQQGQDRANHNLEQFVKAHLVMRAPWREGDRATTWAGKQVWWEEKDGKRLILPDGVEVDRVVCRVANGELWLLKGVMNYQ
ncbi:hypothetical protein UVI_02036130 [Ustilaginoidea virens]|nr:hypothetical protein UVI_02036130 [Ustilaginoidea virens]